MPSQSRPGERDVMEERAARRKRSATGGVRPILPVRDLAGEVEERFLDAAGNVFLSTGSKALPTSRSVSYSNGATVSP